MTSIGIESVKAPKTPLSALIPPGPVVTLMTPRPLRHARVGFGGHGAGLLVMAADVGQLRLRARWRR